MKRTILTILIVALLLAFTTPAHADGEDWGALLRSVACIGSERIPTERMMLSLRQYFESGDVNILTESGWGVGYDSIGMYYHYFGLKCYALEAQKGKQDETV